MGETGEKRVVLVTGGAKRVGRAIVEKLAAEGFEVAFTFHGSTDEATALARSLYVDDRRVIACPVDLRATRNAADYLADIVEHHFGRLDVLVNNASLYVPTPISGQINSTEHDLFIVNFHSPLELCRQFQDRLRASRGSIINMIDILAERPWPQYAVYCATKAALANLTLSLARELAPEVTVNGIAPGVVEWPPDYPEAEKEKYLKRVPLGRPGTPADVANLVHFLATDGSYISGQIIRLDGGRSIT